MLNQNNVIEILQELNATLALTDEAFTQFAEARQNVQDAKIEKYEKVETEHGETVYVPISGLMEDLKQQVIESGQFISQLNGRTTKEERAAELETYLCRENVDYQNYKSRLQSQEVHEIQANGQFAVAEKDYARLHTKVMALRGQLEFATATQNLNAEQERNRMVEVQVSETEAMTVRNFETLEQTKELEQIRLKRAELNAKAAVARQAAAQAELERAKLNVEEAVEKARQTIKSEMELYKAAVAPLLQLAQNLQEMKLEEEIPEF